GGGGNVNFCSGTVTPEVNFLMKYVGTNNAICNSLVYSNEENVGIGQFVSGTTEPQSALHINTNLITANTTPWEVLRTECPAGESSFWRMFAGPTEKATIYSPGLSPTSGANDLVIETP
ncbi:MAG: hypothetical protein ABIJ16_10815, partial [Bacteroidota bacterium]